MTAAVSSGSGCAIGIVADAIPAMLQRCLRPGRAVDPQLLEVPHAYHAPCHTGPFQMQFYWDTFFVNRTLLRLDRVREARDSVENLVHLLRFCGHVPNCNHCDFVNRSQPPMLALMIDEVHCAAPDREWLSRMLPALVEEHSFWTTKRQFGNGLCHYGHSADISELLAFSSILEERLGIRFNEQAERIKTAGHYMAEAESGWDFTPRFEGRCLEFAPVDLNALLYRSERIVAKLASYLDEQDISRAFTHQADVRCGLINEILWDAGRNLYCDWDTVGKRHSCVSSLAAFFPLWCGAATSARAHAVVRNLSQFEFEYGLTACAPGPRSRHYQWDYPNGWAPLHLIAVEGMRAYGFTADAKRVADKFLRVISRCYASSGELWEKYNVVRGTLDVNDEYPMPPLVGWTAATVLSLM